MTILYNLIGAGFKIRRSCWILILVTALSAQAQTVSVAIDGPEESIRGHEEIYTSTLTGLLGACVTYKWTVTGGMIVGRDDLSIVTIEWATSGTVDLEVETIVSDDPFLNDPLFASQNLCSPFQLRVTDDLNVTIAQIDPCFPFVDINMDCVLGHIVVNIDPNTYSWADGFTGGRTRLVKDGDVISLIKFGSPDCTAYDLNINATELWQDCYQCREAVLDTCTVDNDPLPIIENSQQ